LGQTRLKLRRRKKSNARTRKASKIDVPMITAKASVSLLMSTFWNEKAARSCQPMRACRICLTV
jgi:hypothetical protein